MWIIRAGGLAPKVLSAPALHQESPKVTIFGAGQISAPKIAGV
jgi:hypothetical protein